MQQKIQCRTMMDRAYDALGEGPLPLFSRLWFHTLFCRDCTAELQRLRKVERLMEGGFFPESGLYRSLEDRIMEHIYNMHIDSMSMDEDALSAGTALSVDSGEVVSLRGWVITGLIILVTLPASFFGLDFTQVALSQGSSFLLPLGLVFGLIFTVYGAIFIGSHLKEFSERFNLH
jgi:hypothetical protein